MSVKAKQQELSRLCFPSTCCENESESESESDSGSESGSESESELFFVFCCLLFVL